jgi:hypothetical protein
VRTANRLSARAPYKICALLVVRQQARQSAATQARRARRPTEPNVRYGGKEWTCWALACVELGYDAL